MTDDELFAYEPSGASRKTAESDGLTIVGPQASEAMARTDLARILALQPKLRAAGVKFFVPPALLAGIASRESRAGERLDRDGFGDDRHAFGVMQVDQTKHEV